MQVNFNQYRYLMVILPDVPKTWEPIILDMLKQIDAIARNKYVPRALLNFIKKYPVILSEIMPEIQIAQIKQKFGVLKITGRFPEAVQKIVDDTIGKCNNTCEYCGNPNTTHVMVKSWVRNLCTTCKEIKKNGTNS